ncbi:MAG: hypothetical protein ACLTXM_04115 [Enterococcus sp.]
MKFSNELSELKEGIDAWVQLSGKQNDEYQKGFSAGIEYSKEYVRKLESSHNGAIETLKQNIKRFFC